MATDRDFIDFVCEQAAGAGEISTRKMFGEYTVYCNAKPVFLVCDNTAFVKMLPETAAEFAAHGRLPDAGFPYDGAREHYILDIDDAELSRDMAALLSRILPAPKPKKKRRKK
jgi:TfoX/Sxy family transcriptional regulator of competence genes